MRPVFQKIFFLVAPSTISKELDSSRDKCVRDRVSALFSYSDRMILSGTQAGQGIKA